jgi:ABC-2 type transport system permease protein
MKKAWIVFGKEWYEIWKNKLLVYTVLFPPIVLAIIPLVMIYLTRNEPVSPQDVQIYGQFLKLFPQLTLQEVLQYALLNQFLLMFLMMPVIIPTTIAAFSIIGEKSQKSLEPLLATPISVMQLLLGKALAAVIPALLVTWFAFLVFYVGAFFMTSAALLHVLLTPMWLLVMFVISPLFCALAVAIGVIVSSRVTDTRVAQQISGVIVLPVLALAFLQTFANVVYTMRTFVVASIALAVIDAAVFYIGSKLFQRETILTRWK